MYGTSIDLKVIVEVLIFDLTLFVYLFSRPYDFKLNCLFISYSHDFLFSLGTPVLFKSGEALLNQLNFDQQLVGIFK